MGLLLCLIFAIVWRVQRKVFLGFFYALLVILVSVVICAWLVWNWWIESDEFLSVIENVITGK